MNNTDRRLIIPIKREKEEKQTATLSKKFDTCVQVRR